METDKILELFIRLMLAFVILVGMCAFIVAVVVVPAAVVALTVWVICFVCGFVFRWAYVLIGCFFVFTTIVLIAKR